MKNIRVKILIIFGAHSDEFGRKISSYLSPDNVCIICLSLDKKNPEYDLSTYPEITNFRGALSSTEIIKGFLKVENSQRIM